MPPVAGASADERRELLAQYAAGRARLLKVDPVYAALLVSGQKDVENRSWEVGDAANLWVVIVCTRAEPTRATREDARRRLALQGEPGDLSHPAMGARGAIVGAVRLRDCVRSAQPVSVWHNPPACAWVVDRAIAFGAPVALTPDDRFQIQVRAAKRPQYERPLREAVAALDA